MLHILGGSKYLISLMIIPVLVRKRDFCSNIQAASGVYLRIEISSTIISTNTHQGPKVSGLEFHL